MASIESISDNVYEAVSRSAREKEKSYDQDVEAYLKTREKYKTEPEVLLDWIANNLVPFEEKQE